MRYGKIFFARMESEHGENEIIVIFVKSYNHGEIRRGREIIGWTDAVVSFVRFDHGGFR